MSKDYKNITKDISGALAKLNKEIPEVMDGFNKLVKFSTTPGALEPKTKEMIALALGIAAHCDGCIGFHVQKLIKLGITKEEFNEVLGMAMYMGGGPSVMYAAEALMAYEQFVV
jgi:AhpD family alkylhydroperoxidase